MIPEFDAESSAILELDVASLDRFFYEILQAGMEASAFPLNYDCWQDDKGGITAKEQSARYHSVWQKLEMRCSVKSHPGLVQASSHELGAYDLNNVSEVMSAGCFQVARASGSNASQAKPTHQGTLQALESTYLNPEPPNPKPRTCTHPELSCAQPWLPQFLRGRPLRSCLSGSFWKSP